MKFAVVLLAALGTVNAGSIRAGWSTTTSPPGWSSTTTTPPTTGWPSTEPPTTEAPTTGWSSTTTTTLPPTTQPGWSTTTPGWPGKAGWTPEPTTEGWSSTTTTETPTGWPSTIPTGWPSTETPSTGWPSTTAGWSNPQNVVIDLDGELAAVGSGWAAENHQEAVNVLGGWNTPAELSINAGGDSVIDQQGQISQITNIDAENASAVNLLSVSQLADAAEGMGLAASGLDILVGQSGWAAASGEGSLASDAQTLLQANQNQQGQGH